MTDKLYSVSDLAHEFETTPRAIRLYEEKGLIRSQRVGRTMVYDHGERVRLDIVIRSKRLGFRLNAIKEFLDLYDSDPRNVKQVLYLLHGSRSRKQELERQLDDLQQMIGELASLEQIATEKLVDLGLDVETEYSQFITQKVSEA